MKKLSQNKIASGFLTLLLCAAAAALLGWLFSLSYFQHADEATAFREVYDYLALGDKSTGLGSLRSWLRFDNLCMFLGYALRGFSEEGLAAAYAIGNAACWLPALYLALCREEGRRKNWWLLPLFVFVFIPDLSGETVGSYWCRYHRAPVFVSLLILVFVQWALSEKEAGRKRRMYWAAAGGALVFLWGMLTAGDAALLLIYAAAPVLAYLAILWWQERGTRWRVCAMLCAAALTLLAVKGVNLWWLEHRGEELIAFAGYGSSLTWASAREMITGVLAYPAITAGSWNATVPTTQLASFQSVVQLVRMAAALVACVLPAWLGLRALTKGIRTLHPVDALAALMVLMNVAANVLGYDGPETYRYYSAAYFLLAVLLCRAAGRFLEREGRAIQSQGTRRRQAERSLLALGCAALALVSVKPRPADYLDICQKKLYLSGYDAAEEYIRSRQLHNGVGSFYPSAMMDLRLEGDTALNGMALMPGGLAEHYDGPSAYDEGCELFDYIVCDYVNTPSQNFNESTVTGYYGQPLASSAVEEGLQVLVYDYDVRWRPREISGDVSRLSLTLPLGTSRLAWSGQGLETAQVHISTSGGHWEVEEQSAERLVLCVTCPGPMEATVELMGGTAESVRYTMVYAACAWQGEAVDIPAGDYVLTLRGEAVKGAALTVTAADGTALAPEAMDAGTQRCRWRLHVPEGMGELSFSADREGILSWEQEGNARHAAIGAVFG